MAQLVYQLRWFAGVDTDLGRRALAQLRGFLVEIRKGISRELIDAQRRGEIRVREQFGKVIEGLLLPGCSEFLLLSTNWDLVVDQALQVLPSIQRADGTWHIFPIHLHGSMEDPTTIYLPTEVTREPYRQEQEDRAIGTVHGDVMRSLEHSDRSIVYGLSLSPLDAELCMTVAAGWDNDVLREVVIVDPDHEGIAERVFLMLKRRQIAVVGYDPRYLNRPILYHRP